MPDLISFDIDGTLETGNGPGPITLEMVRRALEQGHTIGSASDRTVGDQKNMWATAGIEVSFTINKHRMDQIKNLHEGMDAYYHIGDTDMDKHYAVIHGFEFVQVQTMDPHPWMFDENGEVLWGPHGRGAVLDHVHQALQAAGVSPNQAATVEAVVDESLGTEMEDPSDAYANG